MSKKKKKKPLEHPVLRKGKIKWPDNKPLRRPA